MHARVLRRLLIVLLALTGVALLWNQFGMTSTMVIDARSPYNALALDDRANVGGRSVATLARAHGDLGIDCDLRAGYEWAFCELRLELANAPHGIDLSRFDSMKLWIAATGPEAQQRVRIYVRNFDPAYSRVGVPESEKIDQLIYEPSAYPQGYEVPLSRFTVSQWWIDEHPMTLDLEAPDFRNATQIAFSTGPKVEPGLHTIRIQRIELSGKLISTATFRLGIIAVWMLSVLGYLVVDGLLKRRELRLSAASQTSLQRLNESLRLETRSLAEIARTDPLTGALNRKGLADELTRIVRLGGAQTFPMTLVFIDIDHFKRVNDTLGHDTGDQVIRGLAELVRSAVQRDDLFARWGGEEFLLVFRDTPGLKGRDIAERLRERIASAQWVEGLRVTCSFGVAEWHRGEDLNEGIKRADEAMYRAKQEGRDRVEIELDTQPAPESQPA
ncbi:MAG: GGDEF domain-containing protein [Caulobacter sp.]|nr:GGDEF domain-containing protein [Vitreoscilla sp.]